MAGPFDHLHIKGRTAGSSNELSFDVLDAARSDLDGKKSRTRRAISPPRPSQGSYQGVGKTFTLSHVPEVERRKRARRNKTIRVWVVSIAVIVALCATGAYFGYGYYQSRLHYADRFSALVDRFVEVDKTMVQIDELMVDPFDSTKKEERTQATGKIPPASDELKSIEADARAMQNDTSSTRPPSELLEVEKAAEARENMLMVASDTFKLAEVVSKHSDTAQAAWSKVLAADAIAREASELSNTMQSEQDLNIVKQKTETAFTMMTQAQEELKLLAQEVRNFECEKHLAYIDQRLIALRAAIDTVDYLVSSDRSSATAANALYNEADLKAAAIAVDLPTSISDEVKSAYGRELQSLLDKYGDARSTTVLADSLVRSLM